MPLREHLPGSHNNRPILPLDNHREALTRGGHRALEPTSVSTPQQLMLPGSQRRKRRRRSRILRWAPSFGCKISSVSSKQAWSGLIPNSLMVNLNRPRAFMAPQQVAYNMRLTWHRTRSALACMGGNHSRRKEEAGSVLEAQRQTSSATQSRQTVSNCRVTNRHHNNQAKAQINDSRPSILLLALATRLKPSLAATITQTRA